MKDIWHWWGCSLLNCDILDSFNSSVRMSEFSKLHFKPMPNILHPEKEKLIILYMYIYICISISGVRVGAVG